MELLHFLGLKGADSWSLWGAVYISPECLQEADVLTKEGLLWVWATWMKSDPTLEIC